MSGALASSRKTQGCISRPCGQRTRDATWLHPASVRWQGASIAPRSNPLALLPAELDALTRTFDRLEGERVDKDAAYLAEDLKESVREARPIIEPVKARASTMSCVR